MVGRFLAMPVDGEEMGVLMQQGFPYRLWGLQNAAREADAT
jgi:hypothetical protein